VILQLQDMWEVQPAGITIEILKVPAQRLALTLSHAAAVAAGDLARDANRQSGMYAVLSNDSSMISVRCHNITDSVVSLKLGEGSCEPSQEALNLLQQLQNPDQLQDLDGDAKTDVQPSLGGSLEDQAGGSGDGAVADKEQEGGGSAGSCGSGGSRPAKRHRTD
jgi:hypothetical protein